MCYNCTLNNTFYSILNNTQGMCYSTQNTADISHLYTLSRRAGTHYRQTQQIRALHTEELACYLYKLNNATKIRRINVQTISYNVQTISYINWTNDIADCVTYGISVKRYPQQDIKLQEIRYEEHKNR